MLREKGPCRELSVLTPDISEEYCTENGCHSIQPLSTQCHTDTPCAPRAKIPGERSRKEGARVSPTRLNAQLDAVAACPTMGSVRRNLSVWGRQHFFGHSPGA